MNTQAAKERCLELVNARQSFVCTITGDDCRIDVAGDEGPESRMSLRPRPGETPADTVARVVAAARECQL